MNKKYVPEKAKQTISAFLQRGQTGAPEAAAYEFQSDAAIQLFDDLEHKMADERSDGQQSEMNQKHNYDMLMAELVNRLDKTKDERADDVEEKAKKEQQLAD